MMPSKPFFSVEQTMIEQSICYEVKDSASPSCGRKATRNGYLKAVSQDMMPADPRRGTTRIPFVFA